MPALAKLTSHFSFCPFGDNDQPNIGYIQGDKGVLVIDAGNGKRNAALFEESSAVGKDVRAKALLLTHQHWDHVAGAQWYDMPVICGMEVGERIAEMAAHDWTDDYIEMRLRQRTLCEWIATSMKAESARAGNDEGFVFRKPDVMVDGSVTFDLGGVHAVFEPIQSCHAEGHYVVFVPEDRLVFMGDAIYPNMDVMDDEWYYSLAGLVRLRADLLAYDADWFVESHAAPTSRSAISGWFDRMIHICFGVCEGRSVDEMLDTMPAEYGQPEEDEEFFYDACARCKE